MLACIIAVLVSGRLHRESIYTAKLARRGVRIAEGRDVNLLRAIPVSEVMLDEAPVVQATTPFSDLVSRFLATTHEELLVTDAKGCLVGSVALADIKGSLRDAEMLGSLVLAADVARSDVTCVVPTDSLDLAMHLFGRTHRDQFAVCEDAKQRRVIGVLTRDAVIDAYNRSLFQLDLPGGFSSLLKAGREGRKVEVLAGVYLAEVYVPPAVYGRTLGEADIRRRYGVEVLLIHTRTAEEGDLEDRPGRVPTPETRLHPGDRLLVLGTADAIDRMTH
jgi:CIC family chloride channel protein